MRIAELSEEAFAARLADDGLAVRFGPFVCHLRVRVPEAVGPLYRMYGAFPLAPEGTVVDAFVSGLASRSKRLPWKRPVKFFIDGDFHAIVNAPAIAVPSLEWTLNWAIGTRAHQYLVLHAGAVETNGGALLLPAPPGSGKSTLTAGLVGRGWRFLSDEFAVLREDTRLLQPCPRPISLKKGAIEVIRAHAPGMLLDTVFPGTFKGTIGYAVPPTASVDAMETPARPRAIVFPKWKADGVLKFEPLTPLQAYLRLIVNTVNYEILGETAVTMINDLVRECPAYLFEYRNLDEADRALAERLA